MQRADVTEPIDPYVAGEHIVGPRVRFEGVYVTRSAGERGGEHGEVADVRADV